MMVKMAKNVVTDVTARITGTGNVILRTNPVIAVAKPAIFHVLASHPANKARENFMNLAPKRRANTAFISLIT